MVQRLRGSLEKLTDDERRSLRPIGMTVREAATRTGELLDRLADAPGVRVFAGIRMTERGPRVGFAVSTASTVLVVESVAWPTGAYTVTSQGCVLCDGTYIGQSVRPLLGSVRLLRRLAPRRLVGAVVVVHSSGAGRPSLPAYSPAGPAWLPPDELRTHLARRLHIRRPNNSCRVDSNSW